MSGLINKTKEKLHEKQELHAERKESKQANGPAARNNPSPPSTGASTARQRNTSVPTDPSTPALDLHNTNRSTKNCPHLAWDPKLASDAEAYARKLADAGQMQHSHVEGQGENLYMSSGDAGLDEAVKAWLDEEKDYRGEKIEGGNFMAWGHYSQCVWHSTTQVGMGKAMSKDGATFIVARYTPPGNVMGEKPYST